MYVCCYIWSTISRRLRKRICLRHHLAPIYVFDFSIDFSIVFFFILHVQKRTTSRSAATKRAFTSSSLSGVGVRAPIVEYC